MRSRERAGGQFTSALGWPAEVDVTGVVRLHRAWRRISVRRSALRDDTDRLAAALCWYAVRPGRAGAVDEALTSLSP